MENERGFLILGESVDVPHLSFFFFLSFLHSLASKPQAVLRDGYSGLNGSRQELKTEREGDPSSQNGEAVV